MDPVSIVSVASAASSLVTKCAGVVKTLHELAQSYRYAELSILAIVEECKTIQMAWERIEIWASQNPDQISKHQEIHERLARSVYAGQLMISALEDELIRPAPIAKSPPFLRKSKIVWNYKVLHEHESRLRGQIGSLTLLLSVLNLPREEDRMEMLSVKESVSRTAEDSIIPIAPSRRESGRSFITHSSASLLYVPLSFEDALFTSNVYKRNFRLPRMKSPLLMRNPQEEAATRSSHLRAKSLLTVDIPSSTIAEEGSLGARDGDAYLTVDIPGARMGIHHASVVMEEDTGLEDLDPSSKTVPPARTRSKSVTLQQRSSDSPSRNSCMTVDICKPTPESPKPNIMPKRNVESRNPSLTIDIQRPGNFNDYHTKCADFAVAVENHLFTAAITHLIRGADVLVLFEEQTFVDNAHTIAFFIHLYQAHRRLLVTLLQRVGMLAGRAWAQGFLTGLRATDTITQIRDSPAMFDHLRTQILAVIEFSQGAYAPRSNSRSNLSELTPLHLACAGGYTALARYLLSLSIYDPCLDFYPGNHPFVLAAARRCIPTMALFLHSDTWYPNPLVLEDALWRVIDPSAGTQACWLNLVVPNRSKDVQVIEFLLQCGASTSARADTLAFGMTSTSRALSWILSSFRS